MAYFRCQYKLLSFVVGGWGAGEGGGVLPNQDGGSDFSEYFIYFLIFNVERETVR